MGAPQVITRIIDKSQRIQSAFGIYGAIVIPAPKGEVNKPTLVTSTTQFLDRYTENGVIEVGYDNSFWSALSFLYDSNKLWVVRAANNPLYGGLVLKDIVSVNDNTPLGTGISDPDLYTFSTTTITAQPEITKFTTIADVNGSLNDKYILFSSPSADYYAWFNVDGNGTDPQIEGRIGIEVAISINDDENSVASKLASAIDGTSDFTATATLNEVTITNVNNGVINNNPSNANSGFTVDPEIIQYGANDSITEDIVLIYGKDQGKWNNNIQVVITNYRDNPSLVKNEKSYLLEVYYNNIKKEEFIVSNLQIKDDAGNNLFIEDVLEASNYIRAKVSGGEGIYPKSGTYSLGGGDNGGVVSTGDMITAAQSLYNKDEIEIDLLLDGGWTFPSYQKELLSLAEERKDCFAILSVSFDNERNSDYINSILDYRNYELNANTKWGALFTSWFKFYDYFNDRYIWISPDGFVAGLISKAENNYERWYPILGFTRGVFGRVIDVYHRYTKGEMDILYDNQINPIRFAVGKGIVLWGQKTLQTKPSAFDRINVMMMLTYIIPAIEDMLEYQIGEINTAELRSSITTIIDNYLEDIKNRNGLYDYQVVVDDTNNTPQTIDNNYLICDVYVQPTKSVEFVKFSVIATPTGVKVA